MLSDHETGRRMHPPHRSTAASLGTNDTFMKLRHLLLALVLLCQTALADEFTIADIRVQGLQRVSAGSVFNSIPVNVGDTFDEITGREIIRSLFATGFFGNVNVGRDGDVLVISVMERPSIDSINIEGNKAIETEALMEGLAGAGLSEGEIFQRATLERVALELERQYSSQGRYGASIEPNVTELPRNRVAIDIQVDEGSVSKVRHVNIVGNTIYTDEELLEDFEMQLPGWLSWYTNDDRYSREKLSGDLERLESAYKDSGYVNFRVDSTQVTISPSKEEVYVTINVDEGRKYTVDEVEVVGELNDIPLESLETLLLVVKGQTYSQALVTATEQRIVSVLGNSGYSFADASGVPETDDEDDTVDVRFFVDTGQRAYVRRISFRGNTVTRDDVLRREMRQFEGGWASTSQIDLSKVRLERLGYFATVDVETPAVPGEEDQVDVEFDVEEQPSGSISATLGYSQNSGLILGGNYQENNVFGSGNSAGVGISYSQFQKSISFNYFNPYFTVDGISRGYNAFYRETDFAQENIASFSTDSLGAGVRFGYPINETQRINFGFSVENTDITEGVIPAREISDFLDEEGSEFLNLSATLGWSSSRLNRGLFATAGQSQSLSLEVTMPGSDLQFYRIRYDAQRFFQLQSWLSLRAHTRLGYGDGYGDNESMPFYEHFFAGGFGSVRGYERNTLGPRTTPATNDPFPDFDPFGGNVLISGGLELLFPMPFVDNPNQFRPVVFFDIGNVFDSDCPDFSIICEEPDLGELRYSVGFGMTWLSGFGPLTFGVSYPINSGEFDNEQPFQFELGSNF